MKSKTFKNILVTVSAIIFIAIAIFFIKSYMDGNFNSRESLRKYIAGYGMFGPFVLTGVQALQVVVPVLPGFLGCAVGAVLFGAIGGFICNYVGISLGSVIAFFLARKFGVGLVKTMFSNEKYEKWTAWTEKKKSFTMVLFAVMLLPLFPDDFFCYFAGLTKISARRFIWIIILGKPLCILIYSIVFSL